MTVERYSEKVEIDRKSVFRYLRCEQTPELSLLVEQYCRQAQEEASFRICYCFVPLRLEEDLVFLGDFPPLKSRQLAANLHNADRAVVFCATCGAYFDRRINGCKLKPLDAVIWDAIGTAAVEQLCDDFCEAMHTVRPRFSPGYGDLPLETQKDLLQWLSADSLLGIGLTDSLLMTPTKSVTAIAAQERI